MAIQPFAIWRIRTGGSATNGAGYDGTSYPGGTDYSQQDAAQQAFSATLSTTGGTALMDSGARFTAAMVGNALYLTGGGATAGWYFIAAYASSSSVTLDRAPSGSAISGASGAVGGAWATPSGNNIASGPLVPGNTVYIRGSGSARNTTPDYTTGGYTSMPSGDLVNGPIRFIGENGRPHIRGNGLLYYNGTTLLFDTLYLSTSSNSFNSYGIVGGGQGLIVRNCIFDQNGFDIYGLNSSGHFSANEFLNTAGGTAGSFAAINAGTYGTTIEGCNIHGWLGGGILENGDNAMQARGNIIAGCLGDGIKLIGSGQRNFAGMIAQNTIDGNAGHGINISSNQGSVLVNMGIIGNIITNHVSAGKAGVYVVGTQTSNDLLKGRVGYNAYFNNTSHLIGLTASTNDNVGIDPQYVSRSTGDYRIGTALAATSYPTGAFLNGSAGGASIRSYVDPGAVQRQEPAATGGGPTITMVG